MKNSYKVKNIYDLDSANLKDSVVNSDYYIHKEGSYRSVLKYLSASMNTKCKIINIDNSIDLFKEVVDQLLDQENNDNKKINFSVDISLINRKEIANLFTQIVRLCSAYCCKINICYGLAEYNPPSSGIDFNHIVKPVNQFFSGWSTKPGLPVMTIVGLGYEKDKALGAIEYLESSNTVIYIPNSQEQRYREDVEKVNSSVLSVVKSENKIEYDVESPSDAIYSLDSVLISNKTKYKTVLFPFGPKIFYAASLVSCIAHPEASVWFVSGEDNDLDSSQDREIIDCVGFHFEISYPR
ncbi:transcription elongation factor GreB [Vibrio fluvialis]|uniref:transcription elongation factor GreB n=1 Tax=Vibrio fluvialis TaxID=676 RepID=UPI001BAF64E4|nr:transcription elongation factor GreB [Vibrio fluvialis]EKO3500883.1 transcription elongation factor GreB [Vibrio fluvialis]EKO3508670.1 transcription elongation factor GreB [Vibrio fluvialis]EKO3971862.1 transcription elongation factor GreB [Vibrio fluvialis]EKZ9000698.1 transcription elongation factor GreB [Vibrio fluvialis]ELI1829477.1 transcription elongation factor GreB [Vibrio fluvialis]